MRSSEDTPQAALVAGDRDGLFLLRGNVSFANARQLWEQGRNQLASRADLEIDLSGLERTDSAGVALLLAWTREAREGGIAVRFVNIPGQIRAIASVCGVEAILPFAQEPGRFPGDHESTQS